MLTVGLAVIAIGGVGVALALENQDAFCAACHTEPEVRYYQQSIESNPTTLAAFHTQKQTACIDCHSASGLLGRGAGLSQGAHDLASFLSGAYNRPAITTSPLGDDSCLKCHTNAVAQRSDQTEAMNGHYHAFLPRWQAQDPNAGHCTTCHTAHSQGAANLQFMNEGQVAKVCDACHVALGGTQ